MVDTSYILLFTLLYSALLFVVAWQAERQRQWLQRWRPLVYSLALAVYCSSWTFFGAVGQATANLWSYLPIYLGPMLVFLFGYRFLQKLTLTGEQQKVTSIADFIGSRYGKSQTLSALVTVCALAGSLPYIALQLRAVTMAWETISYDAGAAAPSTIDTAFVAALLLCLFAILFGTRNLEGRERNRGMVTAIAFESLIKLGAFAAVGYIAVLLLFTTRNLLPLDAAGLAPVLNWTLVLDANFLTQTLLASAAIICLPRQFHMAVVEYQSPADLRHARWLLPSYLLLFSLLVLPIAIAGPTVLGAASYSPDSLALLLPAVSGKPAFTIVAFIGGLSAATGMVIVASITLSVMISNELVAPLWLRLSHSAPASAAALGSNLKLIRRVSIALILLLAWQVNRALVGFGNLADLGLLAFAAAGQFAPAILCALYWKQAHRHGVLAGLLAGYALWFYCLILPALFPGLTLIADGPFALAWLRPQELFGLLFPDPLTHGVFWSLLCNGALLFLVSSFSHAQERDRTQAEAFVSPADTRGEVSDLSSSGVPAKQLRSLLASFLGRTQLDSLWLAWETRLRQRLLDDDLAPNFVVEEAERTLAGVVGSATAQKTLALLQRKGPLQLEDIARLVDDTSRELRFSQSILQTTVETVSQGISVIDAELRLVAWNSRYQQLFNYPSELLYIGCPIARFYRINAERGLYGDDIADVEAEVERRLNLLREGKAQHFERRLPDGTILEVRGNPTPGGGFVTTYTDITNYRAAVAALEDSKATLEERVRQRTSDLSIANEALQTENARRAEAEAQLQELHAAKTRFLAYTSHDLMQPLNAARLFVAALQQKNGSGIAPAELAAELGSIGQALDNAGELVDALREISRLDSGTLTPQQEHFRAADLLTPLAQEFQLAVEAQELALRYVPSSAVIVSDRHLLRRILQNLLSNALQYTQRGRLVLGCRRRGAALEIQVWDTGMGIVAEKLPTIFDDFVRLGGPGQGAGAGLGLGLAIARRSADLLAHRIRVASRPGRGSMFSVEVPLGQETLLKPVPAQAPLTSGLAHLNELSILCVDNDPAILDGMQKLLGSWACHKVTTAATAGEALRCAQHKVSFDVLLLDYHLDTGNGVDLFAQLGQHQRVPRAILISADTSELVRARAREHGMEFLAKPVKPAALLNLLRVHARELRAVSGML
jgi:Na+/proline symporter/signal transduction histidine kinase/CheY-like chemotaxis protein